MQSLDSSADIQATIEGVAQISMSSHELKIEVGSSLAPSGGQLQRLSIARVLAVRP